MNTRKSDDEYLEKIHQPKGVGTYRTLYRDIIMKLNIWSRPSVLEIGAGEPDFLISDLFHRKVAVDCSEFYRDKFERRGIEFYIMNLEREAFDELGLFDIAVCSDVFEHLVNPDFALKNIKNVLNNNGVLFSHVPNEFTVKNIYKIMAGSKTSVSFHAKSQEWNDPHLRRFTDVGYKKFLREQFIYNTSIVSMLDGNIKKKIRRLKFDIPFCFERGPTYISTNCSTSASKLMEILNA